jgi:hypothetical protein
MSLSLLRLNHYNPFGEKIKYANLLYNLIIFSPNGFSSCECHTPATARYCSGGVIGKPSWELQTGRHRNASKSRNKLTKKNSEKKNFHHRKKTSATHCCSMDFRNCCRLSSFGSLPAWRLASCVRPSKASLRTSSVQ